MSDNRPFKILCVDDEQEILDFLVEIISPLGFTPVTSTSAAEALAMLPQIGPETVLVISDYNMADIHGFDFRKSFPLDAKSIPFVIVSGYISREDALKALELKISAFAEKPFTAATIQSLIEQHAKERIHALTEERELAQAFVSDSEALVEEMEALLLSLETNPTDMDAINRIFAIAHTIKGASGFFNPKTIHQFTHKFEDYLSIYKKTARPIPPQAVSVLLAGLDTIKMLLSALKNGEPAKVGLTELLRIFETSSHNLEAEAENTSRAKTNKQPIKIAQKDEIKVSISTLDQFMELSGEITVIRNMINKLVRSIEKEMPGNRDVALLSELLDEMHRINSQLQDRVVDLRKVSVKNIFRPLNRALRDLSSNLKKEISFETTGEDIRVDASIAEILNNSLIHMVRNCADHGIEAADVRKQAGKDLKGRISANVKERNQEVIVTISDDGKGINTDAIRKKIVEKGLYPENVAAQMSVKELQAVIFESGFSTSAQVTDVSGRGVGMDMVRNAVQSGGGRIEIVSEVGKGSTFQLIIPIPKTVTIVTSLLVRCGTQTLAIPQDGLERVLSITVAEKARSIRTSGGSDFLLLNEKLVPIVNLAAVLAGNRRLIYSVPPQAADLKIAIIRAEANIFAVVVDEIHDTEDTVVKKLGRHLKQLQIFHGATFLGDGRVGLILDIEGLAKFAGVHKMTCKTIASSRSEMIEEPAGRKMRNLLAIELHCRGLFGIFLDDLFRLEEFATKDIQRSGNLPVTIYRDTITPVLDAEELLRYDRIDLINLSSDPNTQIPTLILRLQDHFFAIGIKRIVDLFETNDSPDSELKDREGVAGALVHGENTITILDANELVGLILRRQNKFVQAS